jgi:hypothetical protein
MKLNLSSNREFGVSAVTEHLQLDVTKLFNLNVVTMDNNEVQTMI